MDLNNWGSQSLEEKVNTCISMLTYISKRLDDLEKYSRYSTMPNNTNNNKSADDIFKDKMKQIGML